MLKRQLSAQISPARRSCDPQDFVGLFFLGRIDLRRLVEGFSQSGSHMLLLELCR